MRLDTLPTGWTQATLADTCVIERGVTFPASAKQSDPSGDAIACLRTANVQAAVDWDDLIYIPRHYVKSDAKHVRPSDILMSTANSRELVGKVAFVSHVPVPSTLGGFIAALRSNEFVESSYLFYFLRCRTTQESLRSRASQTVNIANLSLTGLYSLPVVVAPLAEQRRIVAAIEEQFTRLDAGVAALKRAQAALKRYRAAVLKAAVEGRLTAQWRTAHPDAEPANVLLGRILAERRAKWEADLRAKGKDPAKARYEEPKLPQTEGLPELPPGWVWVTTHQLSAFVTSGSRGWAEYYSESGPLFIRAQDIKTDELLLDDVAHVQLPTSAEGQRTRVAQGDLLVTITGANVAKTATVRPELPEAYVSQHVGLVRLIQPDLSAYVHTWIVTPAYGRRMLEAFAYGAGKPGLNLDNLKDLPIALPPLYEQEQILAEVDQRLSVVSVLEATIAANIRRAERLRQAILERAFTGRLVPQDPADEPASALLERIRRERESGVSGATQKASTSRVGLWE